jgi:hypothetical protein
MNAPAPDLQFFLARRVLPPPPVLSTRAEKQWFIAQWRKGATTPRTLPVVSPSRIMVAKGDD